VILANLSNLPTSTVPLFSSSLDNEQHKEAWAAVFPRNSRLMTKDWLLEMNVAFQPGSGRRTPSSGEESEVFRSVEYEERRGE
jgi:hypothetical protein